MSHLFQAEIPDQFSRQSLLAIRTFANQCQHFFDFGRAHRIGRDFEQFKTADHGIERRQQLMRPVRIDFTLVMVGELLASVNGFVM